MDGRKGEIFREIANSQNLCSCCLDFFCFSDIWGDLESNLKADLRFNMCTILKNMKRMSIETYEQYEQVIIRRQKVETVFWKIQILQ